MSTTPDLNELSLPSIEVPDRDDSPAKKGGPKGKKGGKKAKGKEFGIVPSDSINDREDASCEAPEPVERDKSYYFTILIFLVEGCLFKLPRAPFERNSEVFQDMFGLPVPENTVTDGSSDENPLRLDGVKKADFRQLLKVMFPRFPRELDTLTWQEWFSVLKLAMMWRMDEIMRLAVEKILILPTTAKEWVVVLRCSTLWRVSEIREKAKTELDRSLQPMDRVLLARECQIADWLSLGYRELVERSETISEADDERLGSSTVLKLFRMRDRRRNYNFDLDDAIRTAFTAELQRAEYHHE